MSATSFIDWRDRLKRGYPSVEFFRSLLSRTGRGIKCWITPIGTIGPAISYRCQPPPPVSQDRVPSNYAPAARGSSEISRDTNIWLRFPLESPGNGTATLWVICLSCPLLLARAEARPHVNWAISNISALVPTLLRNVGQASTAPWRRVSSCMPEGANPRRESITVISCKRTRLLQFRLSFIKTFHTESLFVL